MLRLLAIYRLETHDVISFELNARKYELYDIP
jgi:hypothetical protein